MAPQKCKCGNYHMTQQSTPRYIPKEIENRYLNTCIHIFVAALFRTAKRWKQPRCPSMDEWTFMLCEFPPNKIKRKKKKKCRAGGGGRGSAKDQGVSRAGQMEHCPGKQTLGEMGKSVGLPSPPGETSLQTLQHPLL